MLRRIAGVVLLCCCVSASAEDVPGGPVVVNTHHCNVNGEDYIRRALRAAGDDDADAVWTNWYWVEPETGEWHSLTNNRMEQRQQLHLNRFIRAAASAKKVNPRRSNFELDVTILPDGKLTITFR